MTLTCNICEGEYIYTEAETIHYICPCGGIIDDNESEEEE